MKSIEAEQCGYEGAQDRMRLIPNYYRWIFAQFRPWLAGDVIELGVGAGHFITHYIGQVSRIVAVDYDRALLASVQRQHPSEKVEPVQADLRGDWRELNHYRADSIVALDVLEHFEDDATFLSRTRPNLRDQGRLLLKVPAQQQLFNDMDVASGHYRRYDLEGLARLLAEQGFAVEQIFHFNRVGALAYSMRGGSKQNFSKSFSPFILRLANAAIPGLQALDRIVPGKGLSLIAIARKR